MPLGLPPFLKLHFVVSANDFLPAFRRILGILSISILFSNRRRGGVFSMGTRVNYPVEVKRKALEMRLVGVPKKEIMQKSNIKKKARVQAWGRWYKAADKH